MESKFTGGLLGLIGMKIICGFLNLITLFIAKPWTVCMMQRWVARHTIIDGKQLRFDGTGMGLFGKYIIWMLLTIITAGIFIFWLGIRLKKWVVSHTHHVA